jgi:predicted metal-dependent hydrolase
MSDKLLLAGSPPIEVILRRARGLRRMSLRVSGLDQRVTLSVPYSLPQKQALAFLSEKEGWLRSALAKAPSRAQVGIGSVLPYRGGLLQVRGDGGRLRLQGDTLQVPPDPDGTRTGPRVAAFLREQARAALVQASEHYATKLGLTPRTITLRDTRSRWGSCTADGRLMYSWRLIMAPPEVLDYVAAHEVAHLAHMDHSPAYWACVGRLMPDYASRRAWLKANGAALHGYVFGQPSG